MHAPLESLLKIEQPTTDQYLQLASAFSDLASASNFEQTQSYQGRIEQRFGNQDGYERLGVGSLVRGISCFYRTQYDQARGFLQPLIEGNYSNEVRGVAYMLLGAVSRSQGEIDLAVRYQLHNTELLSADGHFPIIYSYGWYQLGEIHLAIHEYDVAKGYYEKGLEVIERFENTTAQFRIRNGLGNCFMELGDFVQAGSYLGNALKVNGISAAEQGRGLCDLGRLDLRQNFLESALESLKLSYEIRLKAGLEDASTTSMIFMAEAHHKLGNHAEALQLLEEAMAIAIRFKATGKEVQIRELLSSVLLALERYKEAAEAYQQYEVLNQKVVGQRERSIFKLKNKQISEQKEQVEEKNRLLSETLDELAKVKVSHKSLLFSVITAIVLVILTEVFLDPFIESISYNEVISLSVKVGIALLLKPMESIYERVLYRRALKIREK